MRENNNFITGDSYHCFITYGLPQNKSYYCLKNWDCGLNYCKFSHDYCCDRYKHITDSCARLKVYSNQVNLGSTNLSAKEEFTSFLVLMTFLILNFLFFVLNFFTPIMFTLLLEVVLSDHSELIVCAFNVTFCTHNFIRLVTDIFVAKDFR